MMKKLLLLSVIFLMSCKSDTKEPSPLKKVETENRPMANDPLDELSFLLINKLDQETFNEQCIPLIQKLYEQDSDKYKMVHIIGSKLSKESNMQAYDLGYENLKKELNKLK